MGLLSNKIRIEDLEHGDHIYTWRVRGSYSHHGGIYRGNQEVIEVNRVSGGGGGGFSSSGISGSSDGSVRSCSIKDFLNGGELYRFEYGVNALRFLVQRPGTCTCVPSDPPGDVVARAESILRQRTHVYDLCDNNCEDFAFYCKTQLADDSISMKTGSSGQIASVVAAIISIIGYIIAPPDESLPRSFIGQALMFCFLYSSFRLQFDAGHRVSNPLRRVPLEQYVNLKLDPDSTFIHWMMMLGMLLLLFFFNAKGPDFQHIVSIFLSVLTSQLSSLNVSIVNSVLALVFFCFTPEEEAKTFYLNGFLIAYVTNPLKLRQYVSNTLWLQVCSLTFPESIHRWLRLVRLSSSFFELVADQGSWGWVMPLDYVLNCTRMLIFWYWTPQDTDLQWIRLFLLSVCLSKFVANFRNHDLPPSEYVIAAIFASMLHNWTPEMTILPWIRPLLLCGYFTLFLVNPNFRLKLGKPIDDATSIFFALQSYDCILIALLIILWHSMPETTIVTWIKIFLFIVLYTFVNLNR